MAGSIGQMSVCIVRGPSKVAGMDLHGSDLASYPMYPGPGQAGPGYEADRDLGMRLGSDSDLSHALLISHCTG